MSFLDELKARADRLRQQQRFDAAAFERSARVTDAACQTTFRYWLDLARQLDVLRPPVPVRYAFDAHHALDGPGEALVFEDFRVDARKKRLHDLEVYDHVVISCWVRGRRRIALAKDFPTEIERLEARLAQAGVVAAGESRRDDDGRFREMRFEFEADVRIGVRLVPDHEQARVVFACSNLDALASISVEFEAAQVDAALLDELSKWWLGQGHAFVGAGRVVKMYEP